MRRILCWWGVHLTPRVFWHPYHKGKVMPFAGSQQLYYWRCLDCGRIVRGGYLEDYYVDERNHGERNVAVPVDEIRALVG